MKNSIRRRVAIAFTGLMIAALLAVGVINLVFSDDFYLREKQQKLKKSWEMFNQEVVFDESDQPLDFTFGIWMPRLTQSGIEAYCVHEVLIVRLPYWMVLEVPLYDDTFHVVGQHILRYSHICVFRQAFFHKIGV